MAGTEIRVERYFIYWTAESPDNRALVNPAQAVFIV
jgi:hypothetical protein